MANSVSNRWAETRCLVTGGKFCYWRHHQLVYTMMIWRWWWWGRRRDYISYACSFISFDIFKASSQRPTSTERTFYRFNYLTLWCEVAPYTHKELYNSRYLAICCCQILVWRLQQREAQQKQLGEEYENRKTDNAWQWKLAPLHESVLSSVLIKIIIRGF